ncbi:tRNA nucleotidyltransferase/poly(A) polymerase family protein [Parachitinimonas caeni]|uniref:Poly A polymerase head domain-containing protein n=1 Tax=Parachitinimonas caeni TaxID=3031301 RepID=A0ABT7DZ22_9NEIS|nr:hypothetical protein [Parachitinimonas caeni]MDK2125317.1 hypothetical protein [Parachitinimonas caeni]
MIATQNLLSALPPGFAALQNVFRRTGYSYLIIGGWIRDQLLGHSPRDLDLLTSAPASTLLHRLPAAGIPVRDASIVLKATLGIEIDIASLEVDVCSGQTFDEAVAIDLAQRDFTLNTLCLDPERGILTDPYNGLADLQQHLLRPVLSEHAVPVYQPHLLLRLVRFLAREGFITDPQLLHAPWLLAALQHTPAARAVAEYCKLLQCGRAHWCIRQLLDLGVHSGNLLKIPLDFLPANYEARLLHFAAALDTQTPQAPVGLHQLIAELYRPWMDGLLANFPTSTQHNPAMMAALDHAIGPCLPVSAERRPAFWRAILHARRNTLQKATASVLI